MSIFTRNEGDRKMIQRTICNKLDGLAIDIETAMTRMDKDGRCRQVIRRHLIRFNGYDIDSIDYLTGNI